MVIIYNILNISDINTNITVITYNPAYPIILIIPEYEGIICYVLVQRFTSPDTNS